MSVNMPENATITGQMGHLLEVRNSGGTLYGHITILDPKYLTTGRMRFARARNTRYFGVGLLELESRETDFSFEILDFKVVEWATPPEIGRHGGYFPGRIDFALLWDGPIEALQDLRQFRKAV